MTMRAQCSDPFDLRLRLMRDANFMFFITLIEALIWAKLSFHVVQFPQKGPSLACLSLSQ